MNGAGKFNSPSTTISDNDSSMTMINSKNVASFQRIICGRPPPTTPRTDQQSYVLITSSVNDITKDPLARSILIDGGARKSSFLPNEYRVANTFASIRQQRTRCKSPAKQTSQVPRSVNRRSPRSDAFGNLTNTMSKLAEQRLILREKSNKKKYHLTPFIEKPERNLVMSDADFATDIPNALELIVQNVKGKNTMELNLLEILKRERLQQARYRLLPINRAPRI